MNTFEHSLQLFASAEPDAAVVNAAQRKLEAVVGARIAGRRPTRSIGGWITAAVSASVVAVALLYLPLTPTVAFAQVQQHFRDFRTLRFDMEQSVNGQVLMTSRVHVNNQGDVRSEVGKDITVIVNNRDKQVLMLTHPPRVAMRMPLGAPAQKDDALDWLDEIRDFQGAAERLPDTRIIDGRKAVGWKLAAGGSEIVLWAEESGLPLEMQVGGAGPMLLRFAFEFNLPLAAEMFSTEVPAGYSLAKAED